MKAPYPFLGVPPVALGMEPLEHPEDVIGKEKEKHLRHFLNCIALGQWEAARATLIGMNPDHARVLLRELVVNPGAIARCAKP
jgi:hypothetical protein